MVETTTKIKEVKVHENKYKERNKKTVVYFWIKDEDVLQHLSNRKTRPYNEYRKYLEQVLTQAGEDPTQKASWSQYAGCTCPCSPGFILQGGSFGKTIHVTI